MTPAGLSLAIGVLIDDAIVVPGEQCATWSAAPDRIIEAPRGHAGSAFAVMATHLFHYCGVYSGCLYERRPRPMV